MQQRDGKKQVQLFKVATGFYETSAGVKVQQVMGSELVRPEALAESAPKRC